MISNETLHTIAVVILPLLFAITLHEAAHGWIAMKFGDKTALMMGRVTLNPAKHIDPFGTIILPIVLLTLSNFTMAFGWAKPVPITWQNLKNPRADKAWVALAGPAANLLMALLWALIAKISSQYPLSELAKFLYLMGVYGIGINGILMLLNLIPLPPLDGSRVISSILPPRIAAKYDRLEPYGIWILLALLISGLLGKALYPLTLQFMSLIVTLFHLPMQPM